MPSFPKDRPPATHKALERWILDKARGDGIAVDRARRALSFMVVAAVLSRLIDDEGHPLFILKGGVAMELRFGIRARASKDYDTAFRSELAKLEEVLEQARQHQVGQFTISATKPEPIGPTGAVKIMLRLNYGRHPWGTVALEVSAAEGKSGDPADIDYRKPAPDLSVFGLEAQGDVPCFSVRYQIAQKLHACTEVTTHKENDRFRDLIDVLLLEELVGEDGWPDVLAACEEVFGLRGKHRWPPAVTVFPGWPEPYAVLARQTSFPITDVNEAASAVTGLIARITAAARSGRTERSVEVPTHRQPRLAGLLASVVIYQPAMSRKHSRDRPRRQLQAEPVDDSGARLAETSHGGRL